MSVQISGRSLKSGEAGRNYPKPGNIGMPGIAGKSQLKAIYKDNADTIIGNYGFTIFLAVQNRTR